MKNINKTRAYSNKNNFNVFITKDGKYTIGNYSFNNKGDIKKCIRCMLSGIKHYKIIEDRNILAFLYDLVSYHTTYESELKFYIDNFDIIPIVNDEYEQKYSNFAFVRVIDDICYYRNFSTNKCIDNIKPNNNKVINDIEFILKDLTTDYSKADLPNIIYDNIDKFVNNIKPINDVSGCYMIDDFYIGRSGDILSRISTHITESFRLYLYGDNSYNYEKCKLILDKLNRGEKLNISVLSDNQEDEENLIKEYSEKIKLTNKIYNKHNKPEVVRNKYINDSDYVFTKVDDLFELEK